MGDKTLYLECYSGISGDMSVAALLDLGADEEVLRESLDALNIRGFQLEIGRTKKCGLDACDFQVIIGGENGHPHMHRNLQDIFGIIEHSDLKEEVKALSKKIFKIVAKAESAAHHLPIHEVHFHEVGALDSIVDIVSAAVCIDDLGIEEVIVSELYEGRGHVKTQHGILPVPVPAVVNIVSSYGLTMHITDNAGEMITPTGAAIASALKTKDRLPDKYKIIKTGIGAGRKDFDKANILRAMLIEEMDKPMDEERDGGGIWILESNIDDSNGEVFGYVMDELLKAGARDVHYIPVFMKKNRPAYMIRIICDEEFIPEMEAIVFDRTSTIGIRRYPVRRTVLHREIREIETSLGKVKVKFCRYNGRERVYPEYESIKEVMDGGRYSYHEIYAKIVEEAINIS